jgi:protein ImuB
MKSLPARRILCLWFPDWPIQRRLAAEPGLGHCAFLLTEATKRGEFVRYGNELAWNRGVHEGMPVSEARTLMPARDHLVIEAMQPRQDRQALQKLALRCERYSFCIGLEAADEPECLLMDVTGIAHCFHGESSLADQLQQDLAKQRFDGRIAVAETIGSAWAAAHFLARPGQPALIPDNSQSFLDPLPLTGLRLTRATLSKLGRLGLQTIGQLSVLDRTSLARRLGKEILQRLDQLTGKQAEFISPCAARAQYGVNWSFENGITCPQHIQELWLQALKQLVELLQPHRVGMRRLVCEFQLEDRTSQFVTVRLREASSDFPHLSDLLRLHLERLRLKAPLLGLRMKALEVVPLGLCQVEFLEAGAPNHARQFSILLNRLCSRLGEKAVLIPQLLPSPIPERAVEWTPVADAKPTALTFPARFRLLDRPTVLFTQPRRIEVVLAAPGGPPVLIVWQNARLEIACYWGPERIESGWWQGEYVRRDYYWVETVAGQRLWIFRRLQDERWFWHGEL